jgi:hypothetical protein
MTRRRHHPIREPTLPLDLPVQRKPASSIGHASRPAWGQLGRALVPDGYRAGGYSTASKLDPRSPLRLGASNGRAQFGDRATERFRQLEEPFLAHRAAFLGLLCLDRVMGDAKPGGERLFYQAGTQAHFLQRESTPEHPPLINSQHVPYAPIFARAGEPSTRRAK